MSELGEKLRRERGRDTRLQAAEKLDVHVNTLARYESGEREPDDEFLQRFAEVYGVRIGKVFTETAPGYLAPPAKSGPAYGTGYEEDFVSVPLWNAEAAAGAGRAAPDEPTASRMLVPKAWLAMWNLPPQNAMLFAAIGASMEPTIQDGDLMLTDTSRAPLTDAIYVFQREGDLQVKRLQRRAKGEVALISDNKAYTDEIVKRSELEGLDLIGRVRVVFKRL